MADSRNWPTEPFTGEYRVKAEQCKKMVKSLKQLNKEHQASDKNRFFFNKTSENINNKGQNLWVKNKIMDDLQNCTVLLYSYFIYIYVFVKIIQ